MFSLAIIFFTLLVTSGVQPTSGAYWIGATDRLQEGKFIWISNNQTELSLGTPFWGTSENIREPNGGSLQNCVAMMKNQAYHFHDVECSVKLGALCEQNTDAETDTTTGEPHCTTGVATDDVTATTKEPYTLTEATTPNERTSSSALETTGNTGKTDTTTVEHYSTTEKPVLCPDGYTSISGRCFLFLTDAVESWTAARLTCSLNNSGRLAYVDNCHLLGDLAAYLVDNDISPTTGYWIGIHDHEAEGIFRFTDGTLAPLTTPLWGFTNDTMEPNGGLDENCVAMIAADDFFLHDEDCDAALAVLCEAAWNTDTQFYM
ncbi:macrophage mannose receptor 1 isoform X2 [Hyalella azteca]|uniref:Macrophage mannose receptor 1 isoform X2 n=1 Tax=Hyalella azteca TaxID=294128 RepID=A0A979FK34_HYAAZ|nr:macrophage mannose receptor 1 isoform X2 [Hyalella azteca]